MKKFKVSVIIPIFNTSTFIDRCVESALEQKHIGEILLIDDRSTDDSWEKCQNWLEKDTRIRIFENGGIKGAGATRNIGLLQSRCDYIAFLDSDDYYLSNRFDMDEILFSKHIDLGGIYSSVITKVIHSEKIKISILEYQDGRVIGIKDSFKILKFSDTRRSGVHLNGLTIKRTLNIKFDEELKHNQDVNFFLKILTKNKIMSSEYNNIIATYNIHTQNTIANTKEAIFYRRLSSRKNLMYSLKNTLEFSVSNRFFKNYLIYDYLLFQNFKEQYTKLELILFAPIALFRMPFTFKNKLQ